MWDSLWINAKIATCAQGLNILPNAALAVQNDSIVCLENMQDLSPESLQKAHKVIDCKQKWLVPGFIDCHTHSVYAGSRAQDIAKRLQGESYENIAKAGGGIFSSVRKLRECDENTLYEEARQRILPMLAQGLSVLEIKSGYGLDLENELKQLRVAKRLSENLPLKIVKTFLGLHTIPPEYKDNRQAYVDYMCKEVLPQAVKQNLVDMVDVFCESIAFTKQEAEQLFKAAHRLHLPVKMHAEQLSNQQGSVLAAQYQALSCDHLEYADEICIAALKSANTVAVILPYAFYFLREKQKPPIELLRLHKVPMALATDCNPGTSPSNSLRLILNMACVLFDFTVEEAILAVTKHAASALGLKDQGYLAAGQKANFNLLTCQHLEDWIFNLDNNYLETRVYLGQECS